MKKKKMKTNKKAEVLEAISQPNKKRGRLMTVGIIALLTIGAFGAIGEYSGLNKGGLKNKEVSNETLPVQTATPKLSKEYVYAGSRMLATEDYGIAQPNPTPTP